MELVDLVSEIADDVMQVNASILVFNVRDINEVSEVSFDKLVSNFSNLT